MISDSEAVRVSVTPRRGSESESAGPGPGEIVRLPESAESRSPGACAGRPAAGRPGPPDFRSCAEAQQCRSVEDRAGDIRGPLWA
eukprot:750014-Hanusia_phi.AAC.1